MGFKAVKMWLQTSNLMFVDGNEFMQKMGDNRLRSILKINNISDKFSSTSDMNTINKQMGGFDSSHSLSATPNFIRNLKY